MEKKGGTVGFEEWSMIVLASHASVPQLEEPFRHSFFHMLVLHWLSRLLHRTPSQPVPARQQKSLLDEDFATSIRYYNCVYCRWPENPPRKAPWRQLPWSFRRKNARHK